MARRLAQVYALATAFAQAMFTQCPDVPTRCYHDRNGPRLASSRGGLRRIPVMPSCFIQWRWTALLVLFSSAAFGLMASSAGAGQTAGLRCFWAVCKPKA